jgi:hypothetical protein
MPEADPLLGNAVRGLRTAHSTGQPVAGRIARTSLEPDRIAMNRIGRQAVEFIADLHDRAHYAPTGAQVVDPAALRAALLAPPPSGPTDFAPCSTLSPRPRSRPPPP